jgi:hypothetical protein
MPHKDPEKRRKYQREYKRRQRAQERLSNPRQTPKVKAYICPRVPHLRLPSIVFRNGFYVTDKPEEQARIEADEQYGVDIFDSKLACQKDFCPPAP